MEVGGIPGMQKGDGPGGKQGAKTRVAGFWRCGVHRVRFLHKSVYNLQSNLRRVGSDLSIWAGQPQIVLPRIIKALKDQGDNVEAVWMSKEPHTEEVASEERIRECLETTKTPFKLLHTRTLIHPNDLPFRIKDLPDIYTAFRKQVEAPDMYREPLPAPEKLKEFATLPHIENCTGAHQVDEMSGEDVLKGLLQPIEDDSGPIPISSKEIAKNELSAFPYSGGETEALERLEHYFKGGKQSPAASYKETR
jgi:deoxyribodipyrimidine photo-lyase